jgi:cytochrome P450
MRLLHDTPGSDAVGVPVPQLTVRTGATTRRRYDPLRPDIVADPYPAYARLREESPVYWDRRFGWIVSRYTDVAAAVRDPHLSAQRPLPEDPTPPHLHRIADKVRDVRQHQSKWLLCSDPPQHTRLRNIVGAAFGGSLVEQIRARIQHLVDEQLDIVEQRGTLDVVADLAYPLPATIIAELLGVPVTDREMFKAWSDDIAQASTWMVPTLERAHAGQQALVSYFQALIAQRRRAPGDDLLSALIRDEQGSQLSEEELVATCVFLLFAGHETTTNLIGNAVLAVLRNPLQRQRVQAQPALIGSAIEELLRYDSPVQAAFRRATVDFELRGQHIRPGDHLLLLLGAANRDPEQFEDPDTLDLGRRDNRHVAFSLGPHYCLGAALARLEGQIALRTLLERFPHMQLGTDRLVWQPNVLFRGLASLPVAI